MSRLDMYPGRDLIVNYRYTFSGRQARTVLAHMLYDLGVFQEITDGPEDVALKNYGIRLLSILAGGEISEDTIDNLITRLLKQPLNEDKEE